MIYGVINNTGKNVLFNRAVGSVMSIFDRIDCGNIYSTKVNTNFPFAFEEMPQNSFVLFGNRAGAKVFVKPEHFDWHEEAKLPLLIQDSFELLAIEFRNRWSHEWRRHSEDLFEMLLELNNKENANDFPLTKALLLDYEAINYIAFSRPAFRMQTAHEALQSFKGVVNEKNRSQTV